MSVAIMVSMLALFEKANTKKETANHINGALNYTDLLVGEAAAWVQEFLDTLVGDLFGMELRSSRTYQGSLDRIMFGKSAHVVVASRASVVPHPHRAHAQYSRGSFAPSPHTSKTSGLALSAFLHSTLGGFALPWAGHQPKLRGMTALRHHRSHGGSDGLGSSTEEHAISSLEHPTAAERDNQLLKVVVCGGGNVAHWAAGMIGRLVNVECRLLVSQSRMQKMMGGNDVPTIQVVSGDTVVVGRPAVVTTDPRKAVDDADIILLALPSHAFAEYLNKLAPFVKSGAWIGTTSSFSSPDWAIDAAMKSAGRSQDSYGVFAFQYPPPCRVEEGGRRVRVLRERPVMRMTARPVMNATHIGQRMSELLGIGQRIQVCTSNQGGGFMAFALANINMIIHPAFMMTHFRSPASKDHLFESAPLLYGAAVAAEGSEITRAVSDEVLQIKEKIKSLQPELDLSIVIGMEEYLRYTYNEQISDPSTLLTIISTNRVLSSITCPMVPVDGGFKLDLESRYFTEDISSGLASVRGLAELLGMETPAIDRVIRWAESMTDKNFIGANSSIRQASDLAETMAPQRFGLQQLRDLPEFVFGYPNLVCASC